MALEEYPRILLIHMYALICLIFFVTHSSHTHVRAIEQKHVSNSFFLLFGRSQAKRQINPQSLLLLLECREEPASRPWRGQGASGMREDWQGDCSIFRPVCDRVTS